MNHPRQAILVTFVGPTNANLNPRFRAHCEAGTIVRECDDDADAPTNAARTAEALCAKLGWDASPLVAGSLPGDRGYVYVAVAMGAAPVGPRWTLGPGKILAIDGVDALAIELERDDNHNAPISPATADEIAADVCKFLNVREVGKLTPTRKVRK